MKDIANQLSILGLINKTKLEQFREIDKNRRCGENAKSVNQFTGQKGIVVFDFDQLSTTRNQSEFKFVAKKILSNSSDIQTIIRIKKIAHEIHKKMKNEHHVDNNNFLTFLYNVINGLDICPDQRKGELIQRMFRKSNPQFSLPK